MSPDEIRVAIRNCCVDDPWTRINARGFWSLGSRNKWINTHDPIAINYRMVEEYVTLYLEGFV